MVVTQELIDIPKQDPQALQHEVERLYSKLSILGWSREICETIAPLTLRINEIKKERGITLLAHSYQTADILFGVADIIGDSLGLAKKATEIKGDIMFCGVDFMAETVKILNPEKTVYVPTKGRDCTLADSITAEDVRKLKETYPNTPVVCYVNTTAEVKAESDICCTSANAKKIIESLDSEKIIFIPDKNMGENLAKITGKEIITWNGYCRTHHALSLKRLEKLIHDEDTKTFAHLECRPEVIDTVDLKGGGEKVLFLTEQGFIDRMKVEYPQVKFEDSHMICVSMKSNDLYSILVALEKPTVDNIIEIDEEVRQRAYKSVNNMLKY
ncbi:MAG: quinolinate synthase NadA [Candidatus Heimdallarchaeaceae archaeon]